jgi:hypothetical protein
MFYKLIQGFMEPYFTFFFKFGWFRLYKGSALHYDSKGEEGRGGGFMLWEGSVHWVTQQSVNH